MTLETDFSWLDLTAIDAARRLLGCELLSTVNNNQVRVRIVEVEAYDQNDEASHTFNGHTKRNDAMFLSAGHMYVYLSYGIHYCCNIVCGPEGFGSGVLVRAVEPLEGEQIIEARRGTSGVNMTNGPGKVCQALSINRQLSGHYLANQPIQLIKRPSLADDKVAVKTRVGISKATAELRRFYILGNRYVSKP